MIIRNHTTKETATRSSLNNRGYERSEHPRITSSIEASTLKECPNSVMGDPFRVDVPLFVPIRGYSAPPVIERRRFQRLGGTIADNHKSFLKPLSVHYGDAFDVYGSAWPFLGIDGRTSDAQRYGHSLDDFAEDRVVAVEVWCSANAGV